VAGTGRTLRGSNTTCRPEGKEKLVAQDPEKEGESANGLKKGQRDLLKREKGRSEGQREKRGKKKSRSSRAPSWVAGKNAVPVFKKSVAPSRVGKKKAWSGPVESPKEAGQHGRKKSRSCQRKGESGRAAAVKSRSRPKRRGGKKKKKEKGTAGPGQSKRGERRREMTPECNVRGRLDQETGEEKATPDHGK